MDVTTWLPHGRHEFQRCKEEARGFVACLTTTRRETRRLLRDGLSETGHASDLTRSSGTRHLCKYAPRPAAPA